MKIKRISSNAIIPTRIHDTDAGLDLYSNIDYSISVNQIIVVPTGIAIEIPLRHFGLIRSRSGLSTENGIIHCSSGIIDSEYRGEISVGLINLGSYTYYISKGDRIAQLIIVPFFRPKLEVAEELSNTERGVKGHGSSGK